MPIAISPQALSTAFRFWRQSSPAPFTHARAHAFFSHRPLTFFTHSLTFSHFYRPHYRLSTHITGGTVACMQLEDGEMDVRKSSYMGCSAILLRDVAVSRSTNGD